MELSVQNVYGLLLRSKLLALDDARAMFDRWQREARDNATNTASFTRWLVANRYLTEYQASLLARGHADGFFLGPYKILDRIGRGRMAGVYKAMHQLGQVVAIKVLPPSKARNKHLLARFKREAKLALRLNHPNIVRTFQVGDEKGLLYLVMEHLEGETLEEVLHRRTRLPVNEAVRIVYQAMLGLQHLHEKGMVHRDLKPSNLMLLPAVAKGQPDNTYQAHVKILDIGLARPLFDGSTSASGEEPHLTSEGVLLGTPDYMAPEQARDAHAASVRADIYSLGCVLYHAIAGQPPFPDSNVISQMVRHATESARPLAEFNPEVPDGLQQIVNWMMAKDPAQRYATPERAAQALRVCLAAGNQGTTVAEMTPQMKSYLTWLEKAAASQPKSATEATVSVQVKPIRPPGERKSRSGDPKSKPANPADAAARLKSRKKKKRPPPLPAPATQVPGAVHLPQTGKAAPPPKAFDVELVSVPSAAMAKPAAGATPYQLSRRDLILFAAGAAGGSLATLAGLFLAGAFRRRTLPEPAPEQPPEPT